MLDDAAAAAREFDDSHLVGLVHIQQATLYGRVGDWERCAEALLAIDPEAAGFGPFHLSVYHLNLGQALVGTGRPGEAGEHFRRAGQLAAEAGLVDLEFKARHNEGFAAFVEGDVPRALVLMGEAEAMDAAVSRDRARIDQAGALLEAGLVDGARSALEDALATSAREGHRLEQGEIALSLARCDLLVGDVAGSREHLRVATTALRSRHADELVAEAELMRATVDVAEERELPTVVTTLTRRRHGRATKAELLPTDRTAARLEAEARLLLGDVDGAERRLAELETGEDRSLAGALHDVLVRARVDLARGASDAAARRLEAGNRVLAAHQFQSASLDVRAGMALHGRRVAELDVERALATGDADTVLATVERWRAISHRINPVTAPSDPELAASTSELRRLRHLVADGDDDAGLAARVADLEATVARREWSLAEQGTSADGVLPATPADARRGAAAMGSTVVEFFECGADLHQVVVTGTRTEVVRLGTVNEVAGLVTRLRRDLRARAGIRPESPMAATLERATASSLAAADATLNPSGTTNARVVVIPSRSLAGMPWSLLPSLRGRPVTVAPSLTRWVRGPAEATTPAARRLAALHGPGLARTAPEIRAVLEAWGEPTADDLSAAPSAAVVDALATAGVVHLAAHGTHEGQSPLFSSVRMADGPVFAHEFPRPVVAEHVVLSACDVGQFSTRPGDEPLGLAIALLSLGATSVLAAVAPVADDVAHDAMVAYHRLLASGADAATAWALVVEGEPAAGVFCLYGSDWSCADATDRGVR